MMSRIIRIFLKMNHHATKICPPANLGKFIFKNTTIEIPLIFYYYMSTTCETLLQTCNFTEVSLKFSSINYFLMPFMFVYFHKNGLDAIKTAMHQAKVVKWTF